jgi:hypothetical protein
MSCARAYMARPRYRSTKASQVSYRSLKQKGWLPGMDSEILKSLKSTVTVQIFLDTQPATLLDPDYDL